MAEDDFTGPINIYRRKGDRHQWREAQAIADRRGISLSALLGQVLLPYVSKDRAAQKRFTR